MAESKIDHVITMLTNQAHAIETQGTQLAAQQTTLGQIQTEGQALHARVATLDTKKLHDFAAEPLRPGRVDARRVIPNNGR